MPYQGDRDTHPAPTTFTTDFSHLKKLPGPLIVVQLVCCLLGFALALDGTVGWGVRRGHAFFTFIIFLSMLCCACWLLVRIFQLDAMFKKDVNWNILGLVHNGGNGFFLMIASCLMLEGASAARPLRAAGVFGFLGFSAFLAGLVWEVIVWRSNRDSLPGFATATVIPGRERSKTPDSMASAGIAEAPELRDEEVSFVGMKPRPVSSFLEQQSGNLGEVSTPMLVVPQGDSEGHSKRSSSASSIQGEWQMASPDSS